MVMHFDEKNRGTPYPGIKDKPSAVSKGVRFPPENLT